MKKKTTWGMMAMALVLSALIISLMSCGGGSGTSSLTSSDGSSASGTGTVALLLADAPTDDYEHIWITITEVSLIPPAKSAEPVVIFKSTEGVKLDLLEYRDEDYLLTIKKDVPAGLYAKIRLGIKDIQVEPKTGAPCSNLEIKLPSGRIDLNPREPFYVTQGKNLSIRLDIDANKSINLHKAGKSGKCIFRPVVFVDIKEGMPEGKCPKIISGTIGQLIMTDSQVTGFYLLLPDDRGQIKVLLNESTRIFDENGNFVGSESLEEGDKVKVRGKFDITGALVASLVVIGDVLNIAGLVTTTVDTNTYLFSFEPASGEEITSLINVKVVEGKTLILIGCDTEVDIEHIQPGMNARVFGKLVQENGTYVLNAVAVLLCDRVIEGVITSATDASGGKLVTINENGTHIDVLIPAGTPIYLEGDGSVPMNLICAGRQVRIFVKWPWLTDPLTAAFVKVEPEKHEGEVTEIDSTNRILTVSLTGEVTENVKVELGATILVDNNGNLVLKQFKDIKVGDYLIYFGLSDCQVTNLFHAFVLVVNPAD